ncbi:C3a anaphylatoxin chemotactic receptor-like [Convolutriloba macropyga]|uniref:C3a anaphylatoxin chemotactic receptor-like n=1 Tax=Convolutriloba macropyga TaxID=536237 RepID=UPI003F51DB3A
MNSTTETVSPTTDDSHLWDRPDLQLMLLISSWVGTGIGLMGLVGNVLVVWTASNFANKCSGQTFMIWLAVADWFSAFQATLFNITLPLLNFDPRVMYDLVCRINAFLIFTTRALATTMLTIVSFDRLLAVSKPFWYKNAGTVFKGHVISIAAFILVPLISCPYLIVTSLHEGDICTFDVGDLINLFLTTHQFLFALSPPGLVFVTNIGIIFMLKRKSSGNFLSSAISRSDRDVTISLVVVGVLNVVCQVSSSLLLIYIVEQLTIHWKLGEYWIPLQSSILIFNNSVNFLAYMLSSSYFRTTFFGLVGFRTHRNKPSKSTTETK